MIKPNELRLGNLIKYTGEPYPAYPLKDGIVEVEAVLQDGVNLSQGDSTLYESDQLQGIPLTPEWLVRMGCEVNTYHDEDGALVTLPRLFVMQPFYKEAHSLSISHAPKARRLRYVHDFQNYYFVLTGEELTIKETV
jgi:hypothetical protein